MTAAFDDRFDDIWQEILITNNHNYQMPSAIDPLIKKQVINQWLAGDRIAAENKIGAGTVSNIVNEWKKGVYKQHSQSTTCSDRATWTKG
jgi:type V secretory pathway adhesin AidA